MMKLSELLYPNFTIPSAWDKPIKGLSLDSRLVKAGDCFIACVGTLQDGRSYVDAAIANGATAVLCEQQDGEQIESYCKVQNNDQIPIIYIPKLTELIGHISSKFYGNPSKEMHITAVTGTNGKTSTVFYLTQSLHLLKKKSAMIGTIGYGPFNKLKPTRLTTSDPIELQRWLKELLKNGIKNVAMEASSHSLQQKRVAGIDVDTAIFTNLTRDHLDYHGSMEAYGNAKRQLFLFPSLKQAIINIDDEFGRILVEELHQTLRVYTYSAMGRDAEFGLPHISAHQTKLTLQGITTRLQSPWGSGVLHSPLLGHFNLSNLLAVFSVLAIQGFKVAEILSVFDRLVGVPGRMELHKTEHSPAVFIDYAHTPDALKQALTAARTYCKGELWCVFGCGGDRDKGKRPEMGAMAEVYADHLVVTNDNPRFEEPQAIVSDIMQGMSQPEMPIIEHDRERAIRHAIACADKDDVVVIAGKGHENYQLIKGETRDFSDALVVQMILAEKQ